MFYKLAALTILVLVLFTVEIFASGSGSTSREVVNRGVGLGSVIAVTASWSRNASILWAILHGILSWLYVIYFALTRSSE